jgi:hypothetical protein
MASKYGTQTAPLGDEEILPVPPAPSIPDLSSVRGFSAIDVTYNRLGTLSPDQKAQACRKLFWDLIGFVVGFAISALFVAAGHWFGAVGLLFVGWHGLKLVLEFLEVRCGAVQQVEGDVVQTKLVPDSEGPDTYYLYIGLMKLEMTKEAYGTLQPGGPYRIYWLWDRVVGGEVLPGWRPLPPPEKKKPTIFGIPLGGDRWMR